MPRVKREPEPVRPARTAAEDEEDVFRRSVKDVEPIPGPARPAPGHEPRPARIPDEDGEWREFARGLMRGRTRFDVSWSEEYVEGRRPEVGSETMSRLRAGGISWQDHLDLHGMTRPEAREAVESFLGSARSRALSCVLIVHGRGKGSEGGTPVLKEKLVAWLTREGSLGARVLAFTSARPCDGGYGAVYVLLRGP
jgi:DNA-nicking Smr family endonuclease